MRCYFISTTFIYARAMALAVSCLRPLGLLPRNIRVSSLALSRLVQQRYDLQVVEDSIALINVGFLVIYRFSVN